jgi:hypothetical protein
MGYTVETALSLRGQQAQESSTTARRQLAARHGCEVQYFTHAAEGRGKNSHRLAVVHTATFPDAELGSVTKYVRAARQHCKVRVECVYEEGPNCKMMYASGRYIKQLARDEGRALRAKIEEEHQSEEHQELVAACTGRSAERRENLSRVYTHARNSDEPARQDREAQEDQGGAMYIPLQVQTPGAPGVHGDGKGQNMRDDRE